MNEVDNIRVNIPDYANLVKQAKLKAKELVSQKEQLRRLIGFIDLTTLSGDDRRSVVENLTDKAVQHKCAAVCVYPARIKDVVNRLKSHSNSNVRVASGKLTL
jgi:hypothetical protein